MKTPTFLSLLGIAVFIAFLATSVYVFVVIQLLPPGDAWLASLIPFRGSYGDSQPIPGVSYTVVLEASGLLSFMGLFAYRYGQKRDLRPKQRILSSLSAPLKFFGVLVAAIVYTETHLFWGEIWYGLKFLNLNPSGFPWGSERVAANTCLVPTGGDGCLFLNYDELLLAAIILAILGWFISRRYRSLEPDTIEEERKNRLRSSLPALGLELTGWRG